VARYQLGQSTTWLLGSGAGLESRSYRRPVALIELEADWM